MKRGITIMFFSLILLLPCVFVNATENAEELELLRQTDIFNESDIAHMSSERVVSRAQFIGYIIKLLDASGEVQTECTFWDVSKSNPYYYDIGAAQAMGLVGGLEDGSFAPYSNIQFDEAVSILCNALGYKSYAKAKGGYPYGYYSVAKDIRLLRGVEQNGNEITWNQLAALLINALKAPIMEQTTYAYNGVDEFLNTSDKNLLSEKFDIYYEEGIVKTIGKSSIMYGKNLSEGYTLIGGNTYKDKSNAAVNMLGKNVKCYYKAEDEDSTGEILLIYPYKNDEIVVLSDDISGYSKKGLQYTENSSTKKIDFNDDMLFVYNGKAINYTLEFNENLFNINYGRIIFIDNNNDGDYDVALIYSYFNIVVDKYNPDSEVIYDKYNNKYNITLKDAFYTLEDCDGKPVAPSALKSYDIITVARSTDEKLVRMMFSFKKVSGAITEYGSENDLIKSVTVDGNEYELCHELSNRLITPPSYEGSELYLNNDGYVVDIVSKKVTGYRVGLLYVIKTKSGLSNKASAGILATRGKDMEIFDLADKVTIDGYSGKNGAEAVDYLTGLKVSDVTIIRFLCNDKNEITNIDTILNGENEGDETLTLQWSMQSGALQWKRNTRMMGKKWFGDDNSLYFGIPEVITNEKDINMLDNLNNDQNYNIDIYLVGADSITFSVVVIKDTTANKTIGDNAFPVVVSNITYGLNKDGENVHTLHFYNGTDRKSLAIDDSYYTEFSKFGIDTGDIILYSTNDKDQIVKVEFLYDYSEGTYKASAKPFKTPSGGTYVFGTVYKYENGYIRYCTDISNPTAENMEVAKVANFVYSANSRNKQITITNANTSQIIDYKTGKMDAYKVLYYTKSDEPKFMWIINQNN